MNDFQPDFVFSSGISASGGHIRLLDNENAEIDKLGWGTATSPETLAMSSHASGYFLDRKPIPESLFIQDTNNNSVDFIEAVLSVVPESGLYEQEQLVDVCSNINDVQTQVPDDYYLDEGLCVEDLCDNLNDLQSSIPSGYESLDGENCSEIEIIFESSILQITELLPNVESADTGKEFVEIYNPNPKTINLKGYRLEVNEDSNKKFIFEDEIIAPFSYRYFSDTATKIILPNSSASLSLFAPNQVIVSVTEKYDTPKDDESWALINGVWQYTAVMTPGGPNKVEEAASLASSGDVELEPCPEGKFRNPETNRCKNIETEADLSPCSPGQIRNPETNRCRSSTSVDNLAPCKEGQERNPETNRCRSIINTASTLIPCSEGQERNPETNRCRKISSVGEVASATVTDLPSPQKNSNGMIIGTIVLAVLSYAIFEWRSEIQRFYKKLTNKN